MLKLIFHKQIKLFEKYFLEQHNVNKIAIKNPSKKTSMLIAAWIHQACDIFTNANNIVPENKSWFHVCKMRAACSHFYDNIVRRDTNMWRKKKDNTYSENSFLSYVVSRYMKSLQRRKVKFFEFFEKKIYITIISKTNIQF